MHAVNSATYTLDSPLMSEWITLLNIWEASVRATHSFLEEADIIFFKNAIAEQNIFEQTNITVARVETQNIIGFIGVSEESLDMIFIHPDWIGKGVGKALIMYAMEKQDITRVEVNEQNEGAIKFYEHVGFKVIDRSENDGLGRPFPILYMKR